MSAEPENFDSLRRLLTVKRHEQPPPGYFDQFTSEVMARLRSGEQHRPDLLGDLDDDAPWVQRLLWFFNARPAMAGAFGVMACAVLLGGIYFSQPGGESTAGVGGGATLAGSGYKLPLPAGTLALSGPEVKPSVASSTNPVFNVTAGGIGTPSLFDRIGAPGEAAPVSFTPAGGR
jgi:hypothetical protein